MKAILVATLATLLVAFTSANPRIECPVVDGEYVTLLPNPLDCTTYYSCNRGAPILMKCYSGLEFNPEKKVCDYPEDAHCVVVRPTSTLSPSPSATAPPQETSSATAPPQETSSVTLLPSLSTRTTRSIWSWLWPRSITSAPSPDELKSKSSTVPPGSTTRLPRPTKPPRPTTSALPSETPGPTPSSTPSSTPRPTSGPTPSSTPSSTPRPTPDPTTGSTPTQPADEDLNRPTEVSPSKPPRPTESPRPSEPPQSSESDSMESPESSELELRLIPIWRPRPKLPTRPIWRPRPRPAIPNIPPRYPTPPRPPTIRPRPPRLPTTTTEKDRQS